MIPLRVRLADDQQMLIEALAARLSSTPDIIVVGHCTTRDPHPDVLAILLRPDVITIEVAQPHDAATLLASLHAAWPPASVVVLTASRDRARLSKRRGREPTGGYRRSPRSAPSPTPCAWRAGGMLVFLQSNWATSCGTCGQTSGGCSVAKVRWTSAHPRERDVLTRLAQGRCPTEIADDLGMSMSTVRTHTNKIFTKLGVHSRLEAVAVVRGALSRNQAPATGVAAVLSAQ